MISFQAIDQHKTPPPPAAAPKHSGAWDIPPIQCNEPDDGVFYAQMGPTGGSRGYSAITSKSCVENINSLSYKNHNVYRKI